MLPAHERIIMELTGKKINFLGDSITQGSGASSPEFGYVEVLKRTVNLAVARNYGIGGTRIARQHTPSENSMYDKDFCCRVDQMNKDADIIVVFGGTNDHGHGDAPMGTDSDRTPDTFCGACHVLFEALQDGYPHSTIVVLTPLRRVLEDVPKDGIWVLKDYADVIRKTAEKFQFPVLDLFETSKLQGHQPEIAARFTTDGLHPNDEGHAILAQEIRTFLEAL